MLYVYIKHFRSRKKENFVDKSFSNLIYTYLSEKPKDNLFKRDKTCNQ